MALSPGSRAQMIEICREKLLLTLRVGAVPISLRWAAGWCADGFDVFNMTP